MIAKTISLALATVLTFGAAAVHAEHTETVIGAAIGGAAGAALGRSIGGDRADVIIWSALGGAAGAAVGHSLGDRQERHVVVHRHDYADRHVVVRHPPRIVHVYEEPVRYYEVEHRYRHRHHHHHRHWRDD